MDETTKVYNDKQQEIMDYVYGKRKAMVEEMFKDGVPNDVGTTRVMNEILSGMEGQVEATVKLELIKNKDATNNAAVSMVTELLNQVNGQVVQNRSEALPELRGKELDINAVKGETELDPEDLDVADFVEE